jgi:hypothetical protein
MASTFTKNLGIEKPATGDKAGTWGTMDNSNYDLFDEAVNGLVTVTLGAAGTGIAPNDLPITDGSSSSGRNAYIKITDSGDLSADVFVQLTNGSPSLDTAEKICFIENALSGSQDLYVFQGDYHVDRDLVIPAGEVNQVKFSGEGAGSSTAINIGTSNTDTEIRTAASGKQTIYVSRSAMFPAKTAGAVAGQIETTAGRPDIYTLDFVNTSDTYAQFEMAFPKQWDEGTVSFKAFWSSSATDTDGVSWALQAVAVSDGDSINVAYGTAVVVDDANQSIANLLLITDESGTITIGGSPAEGDLVYFQIFRDVSDANDTAAEDARLRGVQVFWTNDTTIDD